MKDIIFSDLGNICIPNENISLKRLKTKWTSYEYETDEISGTMLISPGIGRPKDIKFSPKLNGWYKIFVGMTDHFSHGSRIDMKLSNDAAFMHLATSIEGKYGEHFIEEVFWKCALMDNQEVFIGKHSSLSNNQNSTLAWVRFAPMSDDETANFIKENQRQDIKRLYTTNDTHCMNIAYDMSDPDSWLNIVEEQIQSDAEWIAFEHSPIAYNELSEPCDVEEFSFVDPYMYDSVIGFKRNYSQEMSEKVVKYGQSKNFKMCISLRLALFEMEYPEDRMQFYDIFIYEHPNCRCIDRDGEPTDYMSFMYPEVKEHIIEQFISMAKTGCDAVQPLFSRGWPYILFEQPFLEKFYERYGTDARELPLDDERIIELKCELMTDFMRELRNRLNEVRKENPIELHAKVLFSVYDNLLLGLDLEAWAKEGLVDRIVSDERRIREVLDDSVWQDEEKTKIDIKKYTAYARSSVKAPIQYDYDYIFEPMADSKGVLKGPKTQQERIAEFMRLEKEYGMTVYIEIMPRIMSPDEIKRKALEIYNAGCEHIGLWDTYSRSLRKTEWSMWRRIGHKEELPEFTNGEGEFYRTVRLLKLDGKHIRAYMPIWTT